MITKQVALFISSSGNNLTFRFWIDGTMISQLLNGARI
ncbi:Hypothetical protein LOCK900_0485 [Lacticaseibacillus rhamnosus LOCK900]|nr:Hypothetical protein LOCK900_0485 [Lacticaseibacillus rhamnosus LOCK900]